MNWWTTCHHTSPDLSVAAGCVSANQMLIRSTVVAGSRVNKSSSCRSSKRWISSSMLRMIHFIQFKGPILTETHAVTIVSPTPSLVSALQLSEMFGNSSQLTDKACSCWGEVWFRLQFTDDVHWTLCWPLCHKTVIEDCFLEKLQIIFSVSSKSSLLSEASTEIRVWAWTACYPPLIKVEPAEFKSFESEGEKRGSGTRCSFNVLSAAVMNPDTGSDMSVSCLSV